ncbi:hypothetical protein BsWGS_08046 [Bradybaena similaris]
MCSSNQTVLLTDDIRLVHIVCSLTISIIGIFGNLLSLALICKARLCHGCPRMMLIINLCISNLISTGVIVPVIAVSNIYQRWIFGDIFCKLFGYIMYVTLTSECLIISNLAVCQYLIIVHRVSIKAIVFNRCKYLRLFTLLGLPWVIGASAFTAPLTEIWDTFGYDYRKGYCSILRRHNGYGIQGAVTSSLILIMTVIIFYCYPAILYTHIRSSRMVRHSTNSRGTRVTDCVRSTHLMILAIMINYLVTYLPFLTISIIDPCITETPLLAYTAIMYICWSHTAINPVIYGLLNSRVTALWKNAFQSTFCHLSQIPPRR